MNKSSTSIRRGLSIAGFLLLTSAALACEDDHDDGDDGHDEDAADSEGAHGGEIPSELEGATNPNAPDDATALAAGQALYEANCTMCHGPTGKGDGPAGGSGHPPADLSSATATAWEDDYFYWRVADGIVDDGMPAFEDALSEEEIWQLVTYCRTFAG